MTSHSSPSSSSFPSPDPDDPLDDIDVLFSHHLDRAEVPSDFTQRVLASTVARRDTAASTFAWPWTVVGLAALTVLVLAGYNVGAALGGSSGLDLLSAVASDIDLLVAVPDEVLAAIADIVPWWLIALSGISAGFLVVAIGNLTLHGGSSRLRREQTA